MFDDWPVGCRAIAARLQPMLCRHGAEFRTKGGPRQVRACWPHMRGSKNPWIAILICAPGDSVDLKLRVSRHSGFVGPGGPLMPSTNYTSDSERDSGIVRLSSEFPADLPLWIENAFRHCAERYGIVLARESPQPPVSRFTLPEEVTPGGTFVEGSVRAITVDAYERDPQARQQCIAAHGTGCCVCGFSFGAVYGPVADGYIHVHHLHPLSEAGGAHVVDPVEDLRPVCPNCHAVIHHGGQLRSIEEVRQLLAQHKHAEPTDAADAARKAGRAGELPVRRERRRGHDR